MVELKGMLEAKEL